MAYKSVAAEHAFQKFHKDLRNNDFADVLFMYGEEEYLTEWACKTLADKLVEPSMRTIDFVRTDGSEGIDDILSYCDTLSIFSQKRIVWVDEFLPLIKKNAKGFGERELEKVSGYMENPNPQTILIFSCVEPDEGSGLVKLLKKQAKNYFFEKLDRKQLTALVEKRFRAAGLNADRVAIRYLIDETGYFNRESDYRIFNLENDIKKLAAYVDGDKVTEEDIDTTVKGDLDSFVFDFLDAVTGGRKDKALQLLHNILGTGGEVYSVLGLLVNQFELMTEAIELVQEGKSKDEIPKLLKANAYRVKKAVAFGEKFTLKQLKETLISLYEIDRNIKTGAMDQILALELLIGRM